MKTNLKRLLPFLSVFLIISILISCSSSKSSVDAQTQEGVYNAELAAQYDADDYGMKKYVIAFLKRGPNRDRSQEEADALQAAHMVNISRMAEEGVLILAGPFFGDGEMRGIYIFDVDSIEKAEALTNTDPAIQAGSLEMELKEWYGSAALMAIPDLHTQIQKVSF